MHGSFRRHRAVAHLQGVRRRAMGRTHGTKFSEVDVLGGTLLEPLTLRRGVCCARPRPVVALRRRVKLADTDPRCYMRSSYRVHAPQTPVVNWSLCVCSPWDIEAEQKTGSGKMRARTVGVWGLG